MNWGALITADDGTAFITDESTPISLQGIYTASGSRTVTQSIPVNTDDVVLPFCLATGDAYFTYGINGSILNVTAQTNDSNSSPFSFTCYVFTTRAQPVPAWGVAIWNKNGKCILTNETKVLTDVVNIGTKGGSSSGMNLTSTKAGKWAIIPEAAGFYVGVIQQRPFQIGVGFTARYNGSNTVITGIMGSTVPAGGQLGTPLDMKTAVRAIDVSRYE